MSKRPLVALKNAALGFGSAPLFRGLDLQLPQGMKACLVGRNGTGKSSLMRALAGLVPLDAGERFCQTGARIAYLPQNPAFEDPAWNARADVMAYVIGGLPLDEGEIAYRAETVIAALDLAPDWRLGRLSGGEGRRAAIARSLVNEPEVLLLDEPTNHLDLPRIEWLEETVARFRGALLVISHDRAFLEKVSNTTLWLDRGRLHRLDKSFAHFEAWAAELRDNEAQEESRLAVAIKQEEKWLLRGVTARRKRNQGRLRRLQNLRETRDKWLREPGRAALALADSGGGGTLVIEAEGLAKRYPGATPEEAPLTVLENFSTRIRRGERIGIIGPNGAGKTTLIKLLIGELAPDAGSLRLGTGLQTIRFEQNAESLDPEATPWQTLAPDGGDSIMVHGRQRHVVAYLRDFLFDESQARQPIKSLSGGERNRLLLARLFARPANLIVLDEPTNDLDMETLDLLEAVLDESEATLLLVSHDRDFLDRLASGIIALEGDGQARDYAGGYSDYLRQRALVQPDPSAAKPGKSVAAAPAPRSSAPRQKLGYKDQRELDRLPEAIEVLSQRIATLETALADPAGYDRDPEGFKQRALDLADLRAELASQEDRWLVLEDLRESLAQGGRGS